MNIVLYLCVYPDNYGLVFPHELPENYYAPGAWYILSPDSKLRDGYTFEARNGARIEFLNLRREKSVFRILHREHGEFEFKAKRISHKYNKYVGSTDIPAGSFYMLIPKNVEKLSTLCMKKRFYFLGGSPNPNGQWDHRE